MKITLTKDRRELKEPFVIARGPITEVGLLVVELEQDGIFGRGESCPQEFLGQSLSGEYDRLMQARDRIEQGITRAELQSLMPACSGRNALDCALWDLEAKTTGQSIWQISGLAEPAAPLEGDITVCIGAPEWMENKARSFTGFDLLKIKLNRELVMERMRAVRAGAPHADFIVDVNEDWTLAELERYAPQLKEIGVKMIEQPLKRGQDSGLIDYQSPLPLGADESCRDRDDLDFLVGRYDMINIKLDKTGGLTEALLLAEAARAKGFGLMMGCMSASSLSMAPGFVVASLCKYRDLDGASMLIHDRTPSLRLEDGLIYPYDQRLWG
ncbi:L-alanine-DL-glutamate epimerase (EC 5.1.1.n1) [hydrothermal vent metagenome]|uniref:L-alanine-DL-glutamate epimerase n=1 Tax=hydrothermal vent metagenome TaxID=652676 RepID=A0A3B0SGH4_9ZZZZ